MNSNDRITKDGETTISAPFENFFQCYPLVAIYHLRGNLPFELESIQRDLQIVCNELLTARARSEAALRIAKYATEHFAVRAGGGLEGGIAEKWLKVADEKFHSARGACELATLILARHQLTIVAPGANFTPSLASINLEMKPPFYVQNFVRERWISGVRHALNASSGGFDDWSKNDILAAISCLVNIFWLPRSELETRINPLEHLDWMLAIWDLLLEKIATLDHVDVETTFNNSHYLRMQKRAILLGLKHRDLLTKQCCLTGQKLDDGNCNNALENPVSPTLRKDADEEVTLIREVIPFSVDHDERTLLMKYEALREPIRLAKLPNQLRLQGIKTALLEEFPWAQRVIDAALEDLFARSAHGSTRMGMAPLLLVGEPGVGKTRFAHRLATCLKIPSGVVNMAGMSDAKVLKGTSRGWATGRPSRVVELIYLQKCANPIVILDEVDKGQNHGTNNGGVPHDALLDLLETGNAKRYSDSFLMTEVDLSHAMYVLTSNSLLRLSVPLLSRLKIVFFPAPGAEHTGAILKGLLLDIETQWGLPSGTLELTESEKNELKGLSPRKIRERVITMLAGSREMNRHVHH